VLVVERTGKYCVLAENRAVGKKNLKAPLYELKQSLFFFLQRCGPERI